MWNYWFELGSKFKHIEVVWMLRKNSDIPIENNDMKLFIDNELYKFRYLNLNFEEHDSVIVFKRLEDLETMIKEIN
jgi:hypothetical protein